MKITINKKISQIHWSVFLAAGLCFFSAYKIYQEYREEKNLIEAGFTSNAIVIQTPANCYESSRTGNYIRIIIADNNRETDLKVDYNTCNNTSLDDTIQVKYSNNFNRVLQFDPEVKRANKKNFYFSIFSLLLGIIFLVFGNSENKMIF